jgi:hypothetical protein
VDVMSEEENGEEAESKYPNYEIIIHLNFLIS